MHYNELQESHVKLFFKGCPVPLPQWFRQGTDYCLTRKSMLENFPVYLSTYADNHSSIFEELIQYRFTKKPIYSANIIRYNLLLRYTSIQSYEVLLQDFPLPSLSLLQKISSSSIDAVKCANALRIEGKISEDVYMIFYEMYLQISQEYFGVEMIGCDDEGVLYQGKVYFMIVGLKESIPYVIKSSPETNIDANWLKTELLDSLKILSNCGFRVRAIVCDNHPPNMSSFKKLLEHVNQNTDELYVLLLLLIYLNLTRTKIYKQ